MVNPENFQANPIIIETKTKKKACKQSELDLQINDLFNA